MKESKDLIGKIYEVGFTDIEKFVEANLQYLPKEGQRLFYGINRLENSLYLRSYTKSEANSV